MAETCETRDTLVSNSDIAKGTPGRAQALPILMLAVPCHLICEKIKVL